MRAVRPCAAEFAVVVAVVAVGAQNAVRNRTPLGVAIEIPHELQQARLRQRTLALVHYRMARSCRNAELHDQIQRIAARRRTHGRITKNRQNLLAHTRAVTTQTDLILIHRGIHSRNTVSRADSNCSILRSADRCRGKGRRLRRGMRIVTIDASSMPVVFEHDAFLRAVAVAPCGKWMPRLRELSVNIRNRRRKVGAAAMAADAVLRRRIHVRNWGSRSIQQLRAARRIVVSVARKASVLIHRHVWANALRALRNLVRGHRVNTLLPRGEWIVLVPRIPSDAGIRRGRPCNRGAGCIRRCRADRCDRPRLSHVARQAHRRIRVVHYKKVLLHGIDRLHVRIVAAIALHVPADQLHRRIARRAAAQNRLQIVVRAVQRKFEVKGMNPLQRPLEEILAVHRTAHLQSAIRYVRSRRDRSIVAAKAKIARRAQRRLHLLIYFRRAAIERVIRLRREFLAPQRQVGQARTVNPRVGRVAELARRQRTAHRPRASRSQIVNAQHIFLWRLRRQSRGRDKKQSEDEY